jgi:hypothetical protein
LPTAGWGFPIAVPIGFGRLKFPTNGLFEVKIGGPSNPSIHTSVSQVSGIRKKIACPLGRAMLLCATLKVVLALFSVA